MSKTADVIRNNQGNDLFWYLKITGLPYYFFATKDPTDLAYGADRWTLPAGYSSRHGMDVPDDTFDQALPDLLGGIASAERCRLKFTDVKGTNSTGPLTGIFSRLFAVGRALFNSGVAKATLENDLAATASVGDPLVARDAMGSANAFAASGEIYVGGETIGYSAKAYAASKTTFTILARNKYPCSSVFPLAPYYRVSSSDAGVVIPSRQVYVTSEPFILEGRSAALYVGHMRPNGKPETEANALMRLIGRITALEFEGGRYVLTLESLVADLKNAKVAQDLARAEIDRQIVLTDASVSAFIIGRSTSGNAAVPTGDKVEAVVSVASGTRTLETLVGEINTALLATGVIGTVTNATAATPIVITTAAAHGLVSDTWVVISGVNPAGVNGLWIAHVLSPTTFSLLTSVSAGAYVAGGIVGKDLVRSDLIFHTFPNGERRLGFRCTAPSLDALGKFKHLYVRHGTTSAAADPAGSPQQTSLLSALGFPPSPTAFEVSGPVDDIAGKVVQIVYASDPPPRVFIPTDPSAAGTWTPMGGEGIVKRFFTDQGDGSAKAYVRFGDGQVVQLTATNPGGVTLTTGKRLSTTRLVISGNPPPYYYVPEGGTATVDQVLIPGIGLGGAFGATPGALMQLGRLLCSTSSSLIGDSEFNVFPEGVGLGLNNLFDKVSLRVPLAYEVPRFFVVDRDMTFSDVFMAIAKEYGLMLVWSPADGLLTLRRLMLPSGAAVGTSPAINDTNRAQPGDITRTTRDKSFLRSGFKFKWGWDGGAQKFAGPEISFVDNFARDAYQASDRVETYEDKTMAVGALADPGVVLEAIMARNIFTRVVWARIQRSTSRRLMLESPGTYHQIIDGTIPNPFTGSMGITAADGIYGLLFETSSKGASGDGTVVVLVAPEPPNLVRPLSPCALVDFNQNAGGFTNGYNAGTKTLQVLRHYTNNADGAKKDGIDLLVGDKIRITTRDNSGAPAYAYDKTIVSIDAAGQNIVIDTALGAPVSVTSETVILLQPYTSATTARQSGVSAVSFLGNATTGLIQAVAANEHFQ